MTEAQFVAEEDQFAAGHALGIDHRKLGVWIFIASEVMFFGGLIAAFLNFKVKNPSPEAALLDVTLVGVNTFILITSSFTMVLGMDSIWKDKRGRSGFFLALTAFLGVLFLAGQAYEFGKLHGEGVTLSSSVFGSSFYTLTGFHGLHVFVGVLWALRNLVKTLRGGYTVSNAIGIEIFGLYWHFVDIVWIVLFTVIYLI
ncbi:MAG: hypothetical protein GTO18_16535 [Anaerolineales bacterium]|nr:hypothetical protein [Anaerolineales bacterium]